MFEVFKKYSGVEGLAEKISKSPIMTIEIKNIRK